MDVKLLRMMIRKHSSVFEPEKTSGFQVEDVDGEQATIVWRNVGTDEVVHRDEIKRLSATLNRSGYEVRLTKPANTTLIARKVQPIVTHGAAVKEGITMGTFELMVERLYEDVPAKIKKVLSGLDPAADPGYGRVWFHAGSGKLRYSLSDMDEQVRYDEWDVAFKKIKGVNEVEGGAEIGVPKEEGWVEIEESAFERMVETNTHSKAVAAFLARIAVTPHGPQNAGQVEEQAKNFYFNNALAQQEFKGFKEFGKAGRDAWVQQHESLDESATRLPANIRRKMNGAISNIIRVPRRDIPLGMINDVLKKHGYLLVQEDGTPWSGFLTGREGRTNIEIGVGGTSDEFGIHEVVSNAMLVLTWFKMQSGSWETVAYVS